MNHESFGPQFFLGSQAEAQRIFDLMNQPMLEPFQLFALRRYLGLPISEALALEVSHKPIQIYHGQMEIQKKLDEFKRELRTSVA